MNDSDAWADFLGLRDTVHLLVDIGEEPRRYSELKERVSLQESAFSDRMTVGRKIGVWEKNLVERDGSHVEVYQLTDRGETAFEQLEEMGAVEASLQAREHLPTVWEATATLVERLQSDD